MTLLLELSLYNESNISNSLDERDHFFAQIRDSLRHAIGETRTIKDLNGNQCGLIRYADIKEG
jgi:hypothetical protein